MLAETNINPSNICTECEADTFPVRWHGGDSRRADGSEIMEVCFCDCHEEEMDILFPPYPVHDVDGFHFLEDFGDGPMGW